MDREQAIMGGGIGQFIRNDAAAISRAFQITLYRLAEKVAVL